MSKNLLPSPYGTVEFCRENPIFVYVCLLDYLLNSSGAWIYNLGLIGNGTGSTGPPLQVVSTSHWQFLVHLKQNHHKVARQFAWCTFLFVRKILESRACKHSLGFLPSKSYFPNCICDHTFVSYQNGFYTDAATEYRLQFHNCCICYFILHLGQ